MKLKYSHAGKRCGILLLVMLFLFFFTITQSISRAPEGMDLEVSAKAVPAVPQTGPSHGARILPRDFDVDLETIGGIAAASLEAVAATAAGALL